MYYEMLLKIFNASINRQIDKGVQAKCGASNYDSFVILTYWSKTAGREK